MTLAFVEPATSLASARVEIILRRIFPSFCFQAALYAQAADFNKTARFYYMKAQDAYYLANAQVISSVLAKSNDHVRPNI
jgi:hypothetical protein